MIKLFKNRAFEYIIKLRDLVAKAVSFCSAFIKLWQPTLFVRKDFSKLANQHQVLENEDEEYCDFLLLNIGAISFDEIQKHIRNCINCQEQLKIEWEDYCQGNCNEGWCSIIADWSAIRPNLNQEGFLEAWHLTAARKLEDFNFRRERIKELLASDQGLCLLIRLFSSQARIIRLIVFGAPKAVVENDLELLINAWKKFRVFLGSYELAYLMEENPEEFDIFLKGLRQLYLKNERGG